ncbi:hypothetical protein [Caproiciproducens galactitolivorans]|uniref:Uncharacterized protein n=1 Tax=Caproiciproducens galactitolivorans TaxID=642589 RepID=A0ABT4BTI8_9FIRM|nr:hypothetical protein [Caproiciproducens galactitolivorans]MCY1714212.1 hypothetical protein [Caproiciproducens galactitolivorans]
MKKSFRLAFCGIITALCTVLMFLTGLISIGTYALPALSGVLLIAVVIEFGKSWAWPVYIAVSVLSLLLAGDKEAAMLFILFFGYYPILKSQIEKIHNRATVYLLKFAVFNVSMILGFFIGIQLLSVPKDSFTVRGIYLPWAFLLLGNFVFAVYDYALSLLVVSYFQRFHPYFSKWSK